MEQIIGFAIAVIIISASGVLAPGPLFASNIFYGLIGGIKAGIKVSFGHATVELPLIILLGIGALSLETFPEFRILISIFGAIGLFAFAGLQLKQIVFQKQIQNYQNKRGPFLAGILLSALNPFFIIWWLSIGFKLISDSILFWSLGGIGILFILHIWMDFAWLSSTAYLSSKASKMISDRNFRFIIMGLSLSLIYFGITFLIDAFS